MLKKISAIAVLSTIFILGSCKKFLVEKPVSSVDVSSYYKTTKDINAALAGIYLSFQTEMTGDGNGFTGKYFYWGEGRSDNMDKGQYGGSQETELALNALTSGNKVSNWTGLYRTIARANNGIKYFPTVSQYDATATETVVNNALAQCYAMRAMCYFYIIRLWGDAPIRLQPYEDLAVEPRQAKESKDKILNDVIIPDLKNAYDMIQKKQNANIWSINEGAIAAMLADVYMWKAGTTNSTADYTNAINAMNNLFLAKGGTGVVYGNTNTNLEPMATWKNMFLAPATSKEAIWSIHWDPLLNGCSCIPPSFGKSNNPLRVDSTLHANWQKNTLDQRVKLSYDVATGAGHIDKIFKYFVTNATNTGLATGVTAENSAVYLVMYRLSDMFLLYAEALNKTGDKTNALKYLNYIHQRAGYPAIVATDPSVSTAGVLDATKLEDVILQERQWELFAEGKRWFDLYRTNHVNKIMDPIINDRLRRLTGVTPTTGFGANTNKLLWPIYKTLLEDNRLLVQNPSYE